MHVHHVGIMVKEIERSIAWYERMLGLKLAGRHELGRTRIAFMDTGNALLELIQKEGTFPLEGVVNHVAFQVDDLSTTIAHLRAEGVELGDAKPRSIWDGGQVFFFDGPDGETLELFQPGR